MQRQARGARFQGPGQGRWTLPCGMQPGLLCAVLCCAEHSALPVPTALPCLPFHSVPPPHFPLGPSLSPQGCM